MDDESPLRDDEWREVVRQDVLMTLYHSPIETARSLCATLWDGCNMAGDRNVKRYLRELVVEGLVARRGRRYSITQSGRLEHEAECARFGVDP